MTKILFCGTPEFAETILAALHGNGYPVSAVLTQTDKPKGRGNKLTPPPVKVYAEAHGIPVYQPATLKNGAFEETMAEIDPDLVIVAAYGKILPPSFIAYPRFGCINVHGSLLPKYRGAAPIQRCLIDGETVTGVTVMRMDDGLDTGDMLKKASTPITEEDDFESLHDRMASLGAATLLEALPSILDGTIEAEKQDDSLSCYAKKIEKEDTLLDFSASSLSLAHRIMGLSPTPYALCLHNGQPLKLARAKAGMAEGIYGRPGEILSLKGGVIEVACGQGTLLVTELLPAGKKRMRALDYINGRKIAVGDFFLSPSPEPDPSAERALQ